MFRGVASLTGATDRRGRTICTPAGGGLAELPMSQSFVPSRARPGRIAVSLPTLVGVLLLVGGLQQSACSATLNARVDFSDFAGNASAESWTIGSNAGGAVSNAGPEGVGDHAVRYIPAFTNPGFHFHHVASGGTPNPDLLGDYTAAGVNAIQVDIRILSGDILTLRAYLFADPINGGSPGPHAISDATITIDSINDSEWTTYTFPLLEDDLIPIRGSRAELLSRVSRIGFRHDPDGVGAGTPRHLVSGANVLFDNVVLRRLSPGDFNSDGKVDLLDYTVWRDRMGGNEATSLGGNGDDSGVVDPGDYLLWRSSFESAGSVALDDANQVPEPATGVLLAIAGCTLLAPRLAKIQRPLAAVLLRPKTR